MTAPRDTLAFSLRLLADADRAPRPLTSCRHGHLKVNGNTCWAPTRYDHNLAALIHEPVYTCDG